MIYYPVPLHHQLAYKEHLLPGQRFEISESLAKNVISLPIHTEMDEEQLNYITDTVKSFFL
jgi:dTDP-4-amino-4,6-dideoxygalactose transaminase